MTRRLLNLLTLLSLLLCVGVAALWVCRYSTSRRVEFQTLSLRHSAGVYRGTIYYGVADGRNVVPIQIPAFDPGGNPTPEIEVVPLQPPPRVAGVSWEKRSGALRRISDSQFGVETCYWLEAPLAYPAAAAAILPVCRFLSRRRRRYRVRRGACSRCGYDLRATPRRCPECGESAASAPA
jgi:hypothetical protein